MFTISLLLWLLQTLGAPPPANGDTMASITVNGVERTYVLHAARSNSKRPLLLAFHGGGGLASKMDRLTGLDAVADASNFIVVYPQGVDKRWNDGRGIAGRDADDLAFVNALIDRLIAEQNVDPHRIYATGISNGGFFSYRLACDLSDRIAAIAPVAAAMPQALAASCKPAHPVPIVSFSGTSDPLVPYGGGAIGFRFMGKLGDVMPARASLALWKTLDGCEGSQESTQRVLNATANDPLAVDRTVTCSGNLVLYTINGGGHTWPGGLQYVSPLIVGPTSRSLDASSVMWKFLSAYTRK